MPTHAHPMDDAIFDLALVRRQMIEDFVADDGVVCETERKIISLFDQAVSVVAHDRSVDRVFAHLERMPRGEVTEYTGRLFRYMGLEVKPICSLDEAA